MSEEPDRLLDTPFVSRAARWGIVSWAAIGVLVLVYIFFRFALYPVRILFPPVVLALILVYLLNPIVTWLRGRGIPRLLGTFLTYLVLLGALGIGLRFLIPALVDQIEGFARSLPALLRNAERSMSEVLQRFGVEGAEGVSSVVQGDQVLGVAGRLLSLTTGVITGAIAVVLGLILGFYLLVDMPKISRGMVGLVPERRRPTVLSVANKLGRAVGGFFRGQLLVALFVGLATTLALYIVGLPYWALVGMITGLFNLIPLIGPIIGGAIAAFVAFTTQTTGEGLLQLEPGWPLAIGSVVAVTIVQQIDGHILSPNIVGRTVKMHPVTVMLALLAGGTLMGLWGMLLAVPVVASVKILILHAWDTQATWPPPSGRTGEMEPDDAGPRAPEAGAAPATEPIVPPSTDPTEPAAPGPAEGGRFRSWMDRWRGTRRRGGRPSPPQPAKPPR